MMSRSGVLSFASCPRATWWLVMTSPSSDTIDPEPEGNLTDAFCTSSTHSGVGVNP